MKPGIEISVVVDLALDYLKADAPGDHEGERVR